MSNIARRIEQIEKKLRVRDEVEDLVIMHVYSHQNGLKDMLPEPAEEWLTYKEQLKNEPCNGIRIIHLYPDKELEARGLQKVTEGNNLSENNG